MTTTTAWLAAAQARADAATPGPWFWRNTQNVYLSGARTRVVMAFERMGMQGAQPSFRRADGLLYPAGKDNLNAIPDAAFIAHARTDLPAALAALRAVLDLLDDAPAEPRPIEPQYTPVITKRSVRAAIASALGVSEP